MNVGANVVVVHNQTKNRTMPCTLLPLYIIYTCNCFALQVNFPVYVVVMPNSKYVLLCLEEKHERNVLL